MKEASASIEMLVALSKDSKCSMKRLRLADRLLLPAGADVPPIEKDNRRETREIFRSRPAVLAADVNLRPGEKHSWNIRSLV